MKLHRINALVHRHLFLYRRSLPRLMEIFNFEGTGLTSADWNARVHPDDMESYRTALRDCFKQRSLKVECQYRIRAADGDYRWVEDHGLPSRNKAGR